MALHRVRRRRLHPQPLEPGPHPGWLERRHRGGRGRRDGARRHRRRRWRLDPDPVGVLRAVRAEAAARPGHHRADGAPVVVAGHGRAADEVGARLGDRLRRHPRQHGHRPVPRRTSRRRASPRRPAPSPAGCASGGPRSRRSRACVPTRPTCEAVQHDGAAAHRPRARRRRGQPALPGRDARVRAAVLRRRPHRERRGGALRPTREAHARDLPAGQLGATGRRPVGAAGGGEGGREGQPGLRRGRRAAHPDHRAPAAQGRCAGQGRHGPGSAGQRSR